MSVKSNRTSSRVSNSFSAASAFSGFDDAKTFFLKQTRSVQAQKLIVFDDEDHGFAWSIRCEPTNALDVPPV
jgi:hypothetical protein